MTEQEVLAVVAILGDARDRIEAYQAHWMANMDKHPQDAWYFRFDRCQQEIDAGIATIETLVAERLGTAERLRELATMVEHKHEDADPCTMTTLWLRKHGTPAAGAGSVLKQLINQKLGTSEYERRQWRR